MRTVIVMALALLAMRSAYMVVPNSAPVPRTVRGWFENGALAYERRYVDGREEGVHVGWYDDGKRRFEYHYHNGLMEGVARGWFRTGELLSEFNFHEGQERGQQRMWNADGTIRSNYVIRNGKRYGLIGAMGCTGRGKLPVGEQP